MKPVVIAIDFDGTCVTHDFPEIGKDIGAVPILKRIVENGHHLVLYTMRSDHPSDFQMTGDSGIVAEKGNYLSAAVKWFEENDIPLYGIQENPTQKRWTTSPKAFAHIYIDDAGIGCPLIYDEAVSPRPFVDWEKVEMILEQQEII